MGVFKVFVAFSIDAFDGVVRLNFLELELSRLADSALSLSHSKGVCRCNSSKFVFSLFVP